MPVIVGVDSYVTEAEADEYFDLHFGYGDWAALPADTKSQLLRSATTKLDNSCEWYGVRCDPAQDLEHPRTDDCPDVPQHIKDAQCELAYLVLLAGASTSQPEDILTKLKAGSVEMEFKGKVSANPFWNDAVNYLLKSYGLCNSGGSTRIIPVERA